MFVGHLAIALASQGVRKDVPLWALVVAAFSADIVEVGVRITSVAGFTGLADRSAVLSHSIPAALITSAALGLLYFGARREASGSLCITCVSLSHLAVDYVTGYKPSWPGGPMIGLELYRYPIWDFVLELPILVIGWLVQRHALRSGRRSFWSTWTALFGMVAGQFAFTLFLLTREIVRPWIREIVRPWW